MPAVADKATMLTRAGTFSRDSRFETTKQTVRQHQRRPRRRVFQASLLLLAVAGCGGNVPDSARDGDGIEVGVVVDASSHAGSTGRDGFASDSGFVDAADAGGSGGSSTIPSGRGGTGATAGVAGTAGSGGVGGGGGAPAGRGGAGGSSSATGTGGGVGGSAGGGTGGAANAAGKGGAGSGGAGGGTGGAANAAGKGGAGSGGAGGGCGACPANSTCDARSATCICNSGFAPDPTFTSCIRLGGSCNGVDQLGYCADANTWVFCDPRHGLVSMNCPQTVGTYCYKGLSTGTWGACGCGAIDSNGVCGSVGGAATEAHFFCSPAQILFVANCAADSGRSTGFCSTLVTSVGFQTGCFCSACSFVDYSRDVCSAIPPGCSYNSGLNACTCS